MATESFTLARPYATPLGTRLLAALDSAGSDPFPTQRAAQAGTSLGLSAPHTITLLHELSAARWTTRLKKGVYAINDPITRLPRAHPFAIGTSLVTPSAISHWSALQHWGLTEQIPLAVTLSSPVRTFPRASPRQGRGAAWSVAGVRYEFVAITRSRFFGLTEEWMDERYRVTLFDRERALLDAFQHFHIFGSLSTGLEILGGRLDQIDVEKLVAHAHKLGVRAVAKRLGWALERLGVPSQVLHPLRSLPATGETPLDPGRPRRGHHNLDWHVIENLADGG